MEVDVSPNVGYLKPGLLVELTREIEMLVDASGDATIKAMLELWALSDAEASTFVDLATETGFDVAKNSSGWGAGEEATVGRVRFLRERVRGDVGVQASGGMRTLDGAIELLEAGADLLGASSGVAIVVVSAPSVPVVDTTGAGDGFNAALAVGLAEGQSLTDAVGSGCCAGEKAATALGVIPGVPRREAVLERCRGMRG